MWPWEFGTGTSSELNSLHSLCKGLYFYHVPALQWRYKPPISHYVISGCMLFLLVVDVVSASLCLYMTSFFVVVFQWRHSLVAMTHSPQSPRTQHYIITPTDHPRSYPVLDHSHTRNQQHPSQHHDQMFAHQHWYTYIYRHITWTHYIHNTHTPTHTYIHKHATAHAGTHRHIQTHDIT